MTIDEIKLQIVYQPCIFNVLKEIKDSSFLTGIFRQPIPKLNLLYVLVPKELEQCQIVLPYSLDASQITLTIELPNMPHTLDSIKVLSQGAGEDLKVYTDSFFVRGEPIGTFHNLVGVFSQHIMSVVKAFLTKNRDQLANEFDGLIDPEKKRYFDSLALYTLVLRELYKDSNLKFEFKGEGSSNVFVLTYEPTAHKIQILAPSLENAPSFIKKYVSLNKPTNEETFQFQKKLFGLLEPKIKDIISGEDKQKPSSMIQLLSVAASLGALSFLILKSRK